MTSINQLTRQVERAGRGFASFAAGKVKAVANRNPDPKPGMDDNTLKSKVETELFRDESIPKGQINIHVVEGVVELRGEVKRPEVKRELESKARAIPEVREVSNLLHLPKSPPPEKRATTRS
jgi:osmotically-inducible protein OsmY